MFLENDVLNFSTQYINIYKHSCNVLKTNITAVKLLCLCQLVPSALD